MIGLLFIILLFAVFGAVFLNSSNNSTREKLWHTMSNKSKLYGLEKEESKKQHRKIEYMKSVEEYKEFMGY